MVSGDIGLIREDGVSTNMTDAGITDETSGPYAGSSVENSRPYMRPFGVEYVGGSGWHFTVIPEPSSAILSVSSIFILLMRRRRQS